MIKFYNKFEEHSQKFRRNLVKFTFTYLEMNIEYKKNMFSSIKIINCPKKHKISKELMQLSKTHEISSHDHSLLIWKLFKNAILALRGPNTSPMQRAQFKSRLWPFAATVVWHSKEQNLLRPFWTFFLHKWLFDINIFFWTGSSVEALSEPVAFKKKFDSLFVRS